MMMMIILMICDDDDHLTSSTTGSLTMETPSSALATLRASRRTFSSSSQSIARGLFQLSRRDPELLPFSLMLRDEIENFFLSVSCFETRSRISSFQSHASREERDYLLSISDIETRTRIEIETILARIFENYIYCLFNDRYFQKKTIIF